MGFLKAAILLSSNRYYTTKAIKAYGCETHKIGYYTDVEANHRTCKEGLYKKVIRKNTDRINAVYKASVRYEEHIKSEKGLLLNGWSEA